MNERKIRTRRRPQKSGDRIMRAITSKKHRSVAASPAAGFTEDGQSSSRKITTVLFAILLIHLAAVGAIFLHSKMNDRGDRTKAVEEQAIPLTQQSALEIIKDEQQPKISKNEAYTWVYAGDNYQTIAERENVDLNELKRLNKNRSIEAGQNIRVPVRKVEVVEPIKLQTLRDNTRNPGANAQAIVVQDSGSQPASTNRQVRNHSFQKGETLWALSRKYNVSVASIQKANPGVDPTKIKLGQTIKIPLP